MTPLCSWVTYLLYVTCYEKMHSYSTRKYDWKQKSILVNFKSSSFLLYMNFFELPTDGPVVVAFDLERNSKKKLLADLTSLKPPNDYSKNCQ